jgi:predicted DNA-binding transcriptional regulator AlpA
MSAIEPLLVSIDDVAQLTGLGVATLYRYRAAGKLPAPIRLSAGAVRWRRSDIELWIELDCPSQKEFEPRTGDGKCR